MRILGLQIKNFRGIKEARLRLGERTLIVGDNNVGKTTILEALDLTLGPERLRDPDAITEHDFFGSEYAISAAPDSVETPPTENHAPDTVQHSTTSAEEPVPTYPPIEVQVLLGHFSENEQAPFVGHLRPIADSDHTILGPQVESCRAGEKILPITFHAVYEPLEDEFSARTFFAWPPPDDESEIGEYTPLNRGHKRRIGFLYLRSLRTARRAATLQRNSLLDILLRLNEIRPTIWSRLLAQLEDVRVDLDRQPELETIIVALRTRLGNYLPDLGGRLSHSRLQVGRLTRKDLRSQVSYFLETGVDDHSLPFDLFGTGTANLLVLTLLRAIADSKANVIFAMEEPEVALPPHTQRRVVQDVCSASTQGLLTSHSPYVAELFLGDEVLVLQKEFGVARIGYLTEALARQDAVKPKTLRNDFRIKYSEGLLSRATLILEGISEILAFQAVDAKLSESGSKSYLPTDLSGVVLVNAEGSEIARVTEFFRSLNITSFPIWDAGLATTPSAVADKDQGLDIPHSYKGLEELVACEVSLLDLQRYLRESADLSRYQLSLPDEASESTEWTSLAVKYWKKRKGEGDLASFLSTLPLDQQPSTIVTRLLQIWARVTGRRLPSDDPLAARVPENLREEIVSLDSTSLSPPDEEPNSNP